jgi:hypothetical protein
LYCLFPLLLDATDFEVLQELQDHDFEQQIARSPDM